MTKKRSRIGIVAPSAKVPQIELELGVEKLRQEGFSVEVHRQCKKSHLFFAGTDQQRAEAFFEYAESPDHDVLWCARGGHGAIRILPLLDQLTRVRGKPLRKLLLGYSDSTALMEYARSEWGWATLHAPMPSMRKFSILPKQDFQALGAWIEGRSHEAPWLKKKLKHWTMPPQKSIFGRLAGGNLTVLNCLLGTPFQPKFKGSILFLEDIDEGLYRIDRMVFQLYLAGFFDGVKAIVLGNFLHCRDNVARVLKSAPTPQSRTRLLTSPKDSELQLLRPKLEENKALKQIFSELGHRLGIPVAYGLPVGHGPEVCALPLGADYELTPEGLFKLRAWDWIKF